MTETTSVQTDLFDRLKSEVEALDAEGLVGGIKQIADSTAADSIRLGAYLEHIRSNKLWKNEPYEAASFAEFVEKYCDMHYRKAAYWCRTYRDLSKSGVPYDKLAHIGWSKLKEIAHVITESNFDQILKACESCTVVELQAYVANLLGDGDSADPTTGTDVSVMAFKVHDDQRDSIDKAVNTAMKNVGTEHRSVALEHIAVAYMGVPHDVPQQKTLPELQKKLTAKEVAALFVVTHGPDEALRTLLQSAVPVTKAKKAISDFFARIGVEEAISLVDDTFEKYDFKVVIPAGEEDATTTNLSVSK